MKLLLFCESKIMAKKYCNLIKWQQFWTIWKVPNVVVDYKFKCIY